MTTVPENRGGSTVYVYLLALVAALGGLLFGYDTAVISGAIGFMEEHFSLDAVEKGWVASCALLGCIVGAAAAGALSDAVGRKKVLLVAAVFTPPEMREGPHVLADRRSKSATRRTADTVAGNSPGYN